MDTQDVLLEASLTVVTAACHLILNQVCCGHHAGHTGVIFISSLHCCLPCSLHMKVRASATSMTPKQSMHSTCQRMAPKGWERAAQAASSQLLQPWGPRGRAAALAWKSPFPPSMGSPGVERAAQAWEPVGAGYQPGRRAKATLLSPKAVCRPHSPPRQHSTRSTRPHPLRMSMWPQTSLVLVVTESSQSQPLSTLWLYDRSFDVATFLTSTSSHHNDQLRCVFKDCPYLHNKSGLSRLCSPHSSPDVAFHRKLPITTFPQEAAYHNLSHLTFQHTTPFHPPG